MNKHNKLVSCHKHYSISIDINKITFRSAIAKVRGTRAEP